MKIIKTISTLILMTAFAAGSAMAEEKKLSEKLANSDLSVTINIPNCKDDTAILCPGLSKDSKKSMMCLMAYENNLSTDCKIGIIEAALIYEMGMLDINYSINACEADADKHCLNVQPGAGRIVSCLRKNKSKISEACITALKETGMWNLGAK